MKKLAMLLLGFVAAALVLSGCNDNAERSSARNFVEDTKKSWSKMTEAAKERFVIGYDKPVGQDYFQPNRPMSRREGATMTGVRRPRYLMTSSHILKDGTRVASTRLRDAAAEAHGSDHGQGTAGGIQRRGDRDHHHDHGAGDEGAAR